jgi:glycosyltransferase involved in cell wall biosynthesis
LTGTRTAAFDLSADARTSATSSAQIVEKPVVASTPEVLMLIGCWEGESKRYRVHNVAEALRNAGHDVVVRPHGDIQRLVQERIYPRTLVLFRAPLEKGATQYLDVVRKHGGRVVFDSDDLVFDPGAIETIDAYRRLSPSEQAVYRDGVERYRALLMLCDSATFSTEPLVEACGKLGVKGRVVPNSWNEFQLKIAARLLERGRSARDFTRIGYFSGTATHVRDFAQAAPALLRILRERDDVRVRVVGPLVLPDAFSAFAERIERLPFQPYQKMLESLFECDINLAPLETGNPFNEAKSELKWFEAALVEVPTVASPTAVYANAIEHDVTGMLANDDDGWYEALTALVSDASLRRRIGKAARGVALKSFGPETVARSAEAAYGLSRTKARLPQPSRDRGKRIDWIVSDLIVGGGGHRNILRAACHLERSGHDVSLHFTGTELSGAELHTLITNHFYPFKGGVHRYDGVMRYSDVIMATHWTTVAPALDNAGMTSEIMYFVQDIEPLFYPMGTEYVLAEKTYLRGLYCITSGPWCANILQRDFSGECDYFQFPIDQTVYHPRPRSKKERNVVFFAKPEMPRRCYELGVAALRHLHRLVPDVRIVLFGSKNVNPKTLGFPAEIRALVPTLDELAQLYSDADLGIAFSTTNPSLVPYEMMACGLPVVDLGRRDNEFKYGGRFDIALMADPDPSRMAEQIRDLLDNAEERKSRSEAGLAFARTFPSEETMATRVEALILARLNAQLRVERVPGNAGTASVRLHAQREDEDEAPT